MMHLKTEDKEHVNHDQEKLIKGKMEELRKHSHHNVTDDKLRQGALLALGLK